MSEYRVYIDESGDLGINRGTRWFVLSAVIVDKKEEKSIRDSFLRIKSRLNVNNIHLRKITDFYKRAYIVDEVNENKFTYVNIVADTSKIDRNKIDSPNVVYNYICRMLLERVSWYLRDINKTADIVLSARGTSRDGELIDYIKEKLIPYDGNQIVKGVFENVSAKPAGSWDLLQLADICATTMFLTYEENGWGFRTPCYSKTLSHHLYAYDGRVNSYGIKYFMSEMEIIPTELKRSWVCTKKERTPGTTTT